MAQFINPQIRDKLSWLVFKLGSNSIGANLVRGASSVLIINILGQVVLFGTQILLARMMGVAHYGIYVYVIAWLNIFTLVAKAGMDTTVLRYVARYKAQEKWNFCRGILQSSNQIVFVASIVVGSLTALIVWMLNLEPTLTLTFWLGCIALPLLALSSLKQAALQSLRHVVLAKLPDTILRRVFLALFSTIIFVITFQPITSQVVMGLNLLATTLSFFLGVYWLQQKLPEPVKLVQPKNQSREWITTALPLLLVSGIFILFQRTDVLMVGALLNTTEAGIYFAASRVADLTLFGLTAASTIAAPMISEYFSQNRFKELQRTVTLTAWGSLAFAVLLLIGIILAGKWIMALFGPDFASSQPILLILVGGQLINALTGPVGVLMSMTGQQNQLAVIVGVALIVNIIVNYLFILNFGVIGAALATALVNAGWNIAATIFVYRRFQINCFALVPLKL